MTATPGGASQFRYPGYAPNITNSRMMLAHGPFRSKERMTHAQMIHAPATSDFGLPFRFEWQPASEPFA
jgi:hypothetical protein